jgi:hypothetical protein
VHTATTPGADWTQTRRTLASSFYASMRGGGLSPRQIIELNNELLALVGAEFSQHTPGA